MAVDLQIREVEAGDAEMLVENMRQADMDEVRAITTRPLTTVVQDTIDLSSFARTAMINGEIACIWGVCPVSLLNSHGAPWLLSTPVIEKHPLLFLRRCKPYIERFKKSYKFMDNHVDVRNKVAVHWLKWLGFEFDEAAPWGVEGRDFYRFSMRTE